MTVQRFGVSIRKELLEDLDELVFKLIGMKGVEYGELMMRKVGEERSNK